MTRKSTHLTHLDRAGATVSLACAVHCAIVPFAITVLPLLGIGFLADERVERIVLIVSIALAAMSICWGIHVHRQRRILFLFGAALFLVLIGRGFMEGVFETFTVVLGAGLFVCSHLVNRRLCESCESCEHNSTKASAKDSAGIGLA